MYDEFQLRVVKIVDTNLLLARYSPIEIYVEPIHPKI